MYILRTFHTENTRYNLSHPNSHIFTLVLHLDRYLQPETPLSTQKEEPCRQGNPLEAWRLETPRLV